MSDALENPPSFGGNPGEAVPEVDPEDLKTIWQMARDVQARHTGQNVAIGFEAMKAVCKPGANPQAVGYRSSMIWMLNQFAQEQLASWVKDGEILDAVFRTMATIPMEWIGSTERKGLPFDVEGFFLELREGGLQNG
jgi:hypothetical protein